MFRRFASLFSATFRNKSGSRPAVGSKRHTTFRPDLENLETRLALSSAPLHVAGNQLQDSANNPVVLRGVNVISLEWRPDGDNILPAVNLAINNWHSNLLRLPVNEDFWFGHNQAWTGGEAGDGGAAYRNLVDQVIATAQASNVYVMLDMHWSDLGVWGANNGQHFLPDDHTTLFWQDAAVRYANNSAVLFDPYNEPTIGLDQPSDGNFAQWRDGGMVTETNLQTGAFLATYHSPGLQGLIDTIRASGATNVVAPEGLDWGSDLTGVLTGHALTDSAQNLMYQSHLYPDKLANATIANSVVTVANQFPIYVGEWGDGGIVGQPQAGATASNQNMLAWLDAHNYSWTAWALTPDLAGSNYNLLANWDPATPTSDYGTFVKDNLAAHAAPNPPPPPAATVGFADTNDWGTGFTGQLTTTNTGNTDVNGWILEFDFGGNITDVWDAQIVSHVGTHYAIQNASWDATVAAGQSVTFGFNADWGLPATGPSNYVLNGVAAAGA